MFTEVFSIVENDVGHRLKFHHIDGEGVQKIVADAHKGQAKGDLKYLHCIAQKHHLSVLIFTSVMQD